MDFIRRLYGREIPTDPTLWHAWTAWLPVRLRNGRWICGGDVWRRKSAEGWEYERRNIALDEFLDRQW